MSKQKDNSLTKIKNRSSRKNFNVQIIYKAVLATLDMHDLSDCEVSILLTDDSDIRDLNLEYRGIDKPTDVLAFPQFNGEELRFPTTLENYIDLLGDVVISLETAQCQARNEKHSLESEVAFLTVHGVLHLIGYDHQTQKEATMMFEKQNAILQYLKIEGTFRMPQANSK